MSPRRPRTGGGKRCKRVQKDPKTGIILSNSDPGVQARLQKYWDGQLKRLGLSMERGHDPHWLVYGHMVADLDFDGRVAIVPTTGESLERDEWPLSLM